MLLRIAKSAAALCAAATAAWAPAQAVFREGQIAFTQGGRQMTWPLIPQASVLTQDRAGKKPLGLFLTYGLGTAQPHEAEPILQLHIEPGQRPGMFQVQSLSLAGGPAGDAGYSPMLGLGTCTVQLTQVGAASYEGSGRCEGSGNPVMTFRFTARSD